MKYLRIWARGGVGLALAVGLPACASTQLAVGTYTKTRGPGVILWAGHTVELLDNRAFAYSYWSDDISSSRYGRGTYQLKGTRLCLQFGLPQLVMATATARPLAAQPDTLLAFEVLARSPTSVAPARAVAYATIAVYNEQGKIIAAVASDTAGRAVLRVPGRARWLSVQSLAAGVPARQHGLSRRVARQSRYAVCRRRPPNSALGAPPGR